MSEIDFVELEKQVKEMSKDDKKSDAPTVQVNTKPRGRYMDMVHPSSDMRPPARDYTVGKTIESDMKPEEKPALEFTDEPEAFEVVAEEDFEFGVIEDVPKERTKDIKEPAPEPKKAESFDEPAKEKAPNANNYSLGGRSPFISDARHDKRPLGKHIPEGSARGVHSTKNVYTQRNATKSEDAITPKATMVVAQKKHGWVWALVTLLVLAAGGGIGFLAYLIYTNQ